jgi:hypothetical protein
LKKVEKEFEGLFTRPMKSMIRLALKAGGRRG